MNNEAIYDAEIAPALATISQRCMELGMPFIAVVECAPGVRAETRALPPDVSLGMFNVANAAKTGENVDAFFINLARHCKEKGIDTGASIVFHRMGMNK